MVRRMSIHSPTTWVIVALVVIALIVLAWRLTLEARQRQSRRLQQRFGPEYARLLAERGDRTKTEAELRAREKRVEKLTIVALSPEDKAKFSDAWSALQARFVDNPESVVLEADRLVRELMVKRGYPMGDFERRAAD